MRKFLQATQRCLGVLLAPLALSGCMMSGSVESLYVLPQLPEEYQDLREQISAILAAGAEYAPPQSGANLPAVQMVDLDGDGLNEALAFFRVSSNEERPLKICIFRAVEDSYEQVASIDGSGTSIHSIRYEDMNGDGTREIFISWQVSTEVQTLEVYALENLEPEQLVSAAYARYEVADLDNDGVKELVLLRSDNEELGTSAADFYDWNGKNLFQQTTERLSVPVAAVQAIQTGALRDGEAAIFITGRESGPDESYRTVTDILAYRQSGIANIVLSSDTGVSTEIFPYVGLQPLDINDDGAVEVPRPEELLTDSETEVYWQINWRSYNIAGVPETQALTYHNLTDGWYLLLPNIWNKRFTVRQENASASEHATVFYTLPDECGQNQVLFTIHTLTGNNRESLASKTGRSVLLRRGDNIYAVSFGRAYEDWPYAVDTEEIAERFKIIFTPWNMNEN